MSYLIFVILSINYAACADVPKLTQTVYGFLDFTTTIGNTVMVFSPQSSPQFDITIPETSNIPHIIDTKPKVYEGKESKNGIKPTPLIAITSKEQSTVNSSLSINTELNLLSTPMKSFDFSEYALLSRQPDEFVEESYRLINFNTRAETERHKIDHSKRNNNFSNSPGIVQRKKDTITRNVISISKDSGPLSPKSSVKSQVHQTITSLERRSKSRQASSPRVLKTVTPTIPNFKASTETHGLTKSNRKNSRSSSEKRKSSRSKGKRRNKTSQITATQITPSLVDTSSRRSYRTKTNLVSDENITNINPNTLKLNRRPGRWQYKSSPKPKVNIRKTTNAAKTEIQTEAIKDSYQILEESQKTPDLSKDLDAVGSQNSIVPDNEQIKPNNFVQTLNVEISTPSNFDDTYYEIATIKTPYIFQAGLVKKTRFLTVTSTLEKSITNDQIEEYSANDGPLTENILESTVMIKPSMDGIVTTLKPIHYSDSLETPELEKITESFSFTQTKLKTQILPVIFDKQNETTHITLIQTYDYTSFVTVTQTVSPFRDNFIPSKNFKDFEAILDEAGSEINLDLEFGDDGNSGQFDVNSNSNKNVDLKGILNSSNAKGPMELHDSEQVSKSENSEIFGQGKSIITTTRPIIKVDTVWESYVIPLVRGTESILRTLSKSVGEVKKTEYVTDVSTILLPMSQYPYSINPYYNPLLPIPQQQLITSTSIYETLITATSSKVLKLTFGARTAYTTLFSTSIVPTAVSKLVTATIPIQNSGSFQNYYPPPFPPFAYVG